MIVLYPKLKMKILQLYLLKFIILENFQKNFLGLSKLIIRNGANDNDDLKVLEIKENKQLKTDKIIFTGNARVEIKI